MKMLNDEDGFIHVSKKQHNSKFNQSTYEKHQHLITDTTDDESDDDQIEQLTDHQLEKIVKFYDTKATKFMRTNYFKNFNDLFNDLMKRDQQLNKSIKKKIRFDQVICYGLGKFNKETICRKQLYFLICLRKLINCSSWQIYDPIFDSDEKSILKRLGFVLIDKNEDCRRSIKDADCVKKSLFYMPHCHKFMFNNLFWSNWNIESLNNLYLIGNSFEFMTYNSIEKSDLQDYAYLHHLKKLKIVDEIKISNFYSNKLVFNDLSIHTFSKTTHLNQSNLDQLFNSQFPIYPSSR